MDDYRFICVYWHEKGRRGVAREVGKLYKDLAGPFTWDMVRECLTYQPRDTDVWIVLDDCAVLAWPSENAAARHWLAVKLHPPGFPIQDTAYGRLLWQGEREPDKTQSTDPYQDVT